PRGAPADAAEPGPPRRHDARPRADHRGGDPPHGRRVGRRGGDRPPRLLRRADHLHHVGVPDRQAVPRGAGLLVRPPLPRPGARPPPSPRHYHDLERGTDAIAYVDAYADIESFRLRDAARERLVGLVGGIIDRRKARGKVPREERDLLDVLISLDMSADHITGI